MPPQRRKGGLEFFKRHSDPASWGLRAYLKTKHGDMTSQHILDGWKKSLILILQSTGSEFTEAQRARAAELLERYKQKVKPFFCRRCCNNYRRCDGSCTLHCTLPRRIPLRTAPVGLLALRSSLQIMVLFGRRKASSLVLDQWGLVVAVSLGGRMYLVFDYRC